VDFVARWEVILRRKKITAVEKEAHMKSTSMNKVVAVLASMFVLALSPSTAASIAYGTLNNFDCVRIGRTVFFTSALSRSQKFTATPRTTTVGSSSGLKI
jgi:hypothetical protein